MVIMLNPILRIKKSFDSGVASDKLKSLFKHHKRKEVVVENDEYFESVWNDANMFRVIYFECEDDMFDSKECCKSKDGTCATIECPHNYRRYGDDVYEHYKEICKE